MLLSSTIRTIAKFSQARSSLARPSRNDKSRVRKVPLARRRTPNPFHQTVSLRRLPMAILATARATTPSPTSTRRGTPSREKWTRSTRRSRLTSRAAPFLSLRSSSLERDCKPSSRSRSQDCREVEAVVNERSMIRGISEYLINAVCATIYTAASLSDIIILRFSSVLDTMSDQQKGQRVRFLRHANTSRD